MKRIISLALAMILCLGLLTVGASAASASGYFTGPDEVRPDDTITLTFGVSGTGICLSEPVRRPDSYYFQ